MLVTTAGKMINVRIKDAVCIPLRNPSMVENVQRRATKLILNLPFRCDVTYKTRIQLTKSVTHLILT